MMATDYQDSSSAAGESKSADASTTLLPLLNPNHIPSTDSQQVQSRTPQKVKSRGIDTLVSLALLLATLPLFVFAIVVALQDGRTVGTEWSTIQTIFNKAGSFTYLPRYSSSPHIADADHMLCW